jgi:cephalosporin hydroxylase
MNIQIVEDIITYQGIDYNIGSPEAFKIISDLWLRSGWDVKYVYSFTWLGRPIIQLPEDMIRIQELLFNLKPDIIIETGVAHGGSIIFYATICKAIEKGRVIGIDIDIREHNRACIENHILYPFITLIEGDSVDERTVDQVKSLINPESRVIVILDSKHSYQHVYKELKYYSGMVSVGSYIIVTDGIMEKLTGAPRTSIDWEYNNPKKAAEDFVKYNDDFLIEEPGFAFNEGLNNERVTYWPSAYIKRIR